VVCGLWFVVCGLWFWIFKYFSYMKTILYLLFVVCVGVACSEKNELAENDNTPFASIDSAEVYPAFDWDTLKGIYIGDFAGSEIRIKITYVSNKNVVGYNIHKGLLRNISGKVSETQDSVILYMDEPGDNQFDGTFQILIDRQNLNVNGTWVPFNKKLSKKAFTLKKLIPEDYNDNAVISNANFANYFSYVGDSLGDFYFSDDGFVVYSYYPRLDEIHRNEQLESVKGSWSVKGKDVIINWQENPVFPAKMSTFKIGKEEYYRTLKGEGRELTDMYGGF